MLYIVEMALAPGHSDVEWTRWTSEMKSAELLMTVPGFLSAQRFKGISDPLAYCGIYSIRDAGVMTSPAYKGVGGGVRVQQWNSHITYWNRDIVEGVRIAPAVSDGYVLLIRNEEKIGFPDAGLPYIRLAVTGLNRSVKYKGMAIIPEQDAQELARTDTAARIYRPYEAQLLNLAEAEAPAN